MEASARLPLRGAGCGKRNSVSFFGLAWVGIGDGGRGIRQVGRAAEWVDGSAKLPDLFASDGRPHTVPALGWGWPWWLARVVARRWLDIRSPYVKAKPKAGQARRAGGR